ncbi:MAG: cyclase family protein [Pseudomonadales bacterium]|nr:cyclase family protein [Pseudomonadales bacterium]|tara:strand:- start:113 stop:1045 length:933 start_codon:yes stop_codon:yes gene_type:complete
MSETNYSTSDMEAMFESVKNWGKWGAEDERGALNYITAEKIAEGARLVRTGESVSCALQFPTRPAPDNPRPAQHMMVVAGDACTHGDGIESAMDYIGVAFHGMAVSHLDALCHVFVKEEMYNGFKSSDVLSTGATRNTVMAGKDGISGRAVLLDIPRFRGVEWLEIDQAISADELESAADEQGIQVGEGDILLVSTGRDARRRARGSWSPADGLAGMNASCVPWFHDRRIAMLGCDGVSDAIPSGDAEGWPMPIHQCGIVGMGLHLLDNLRLDLLAQACERHERWEFFLVVAPLRVKRGTGSPVNPIAFF